MATTVSAAMTTGLVKDTDKAAKNGLAALEGNVPQINSAGKIPSQLLSTGVHLGGTDAAHLLDDYEEGTFTATATPGTSGTITLTDSTLSYTKIGQLVFISGNLTINALSSPVGSINVGGLPFTASVDAMANVNISDPSSGDISFSGWLLTSHNNILKIYENTGTQPANSANLLQTSSVIYISLTYMTGQ
tara:strand:+ start:1567 stop:2136 length:570 start_codon:yes stop_codon:yes gene_type:complete